MATPETTIVAPPKLDDYSITVREFDPMGRETQWAVAAPTGPDFKTWTLMQQVAMLKKGTWQKYPITDILFAIAYAHNLSVESGANVDIMQGDVYSTGDGRIATSNKCKIKMALATGKIDSIESTLVELAGPAPAGCIAEHDLECTVVLGVKGFSKPIVNKSRLSRWFKKNNPNWVGNPEHMLKLNTLAHACELVHPTATEADELPDVETTTLTKGASQ